jgi:hypothetical protein
VLLPDHAYVFDLTTRRPAWSLWIGELPELDVHLPAATIQALRDLAADTTQELPPADTSQQQRVSDSISNIWARLRSLRRPGEPWADAALRAELAGDLQEAAKIHRANDSMLRAAHLFERAAREAPAQR